MYESEKKIAFDFAKEQPVTALKCSIGDEMAGSNDGTSIQPISDTDKDELNKIIEEYNIKTPLDKFPQIQGTARPKFKQNTDSRKNISKQNTLENRIQGQELFGVN